MAMGRLLFSAITSVDGYVADADGRFDWSAPDEEVHAAVNDSVRTVGTQLYGRRMYEVLKVWETMDVGTAALPYSDFQDLWRRADKVVYSTTLERTESARTRIERRFDPPAVAAFARGLDHDVSIGGPRLAAAALRAGIVDVVELFLSPVAVGGGNAALPAGLRLPLRLQNSRRFANGVVQLRYEVG